MIRTVRRSVDSDSVRWRVAATAPSTDSYWTAGRRHFLAGEVTLAPGQAVTTTRLTCTDLAWLHLTPLGHGRALLQAMVPGPVERPAPARPRRSARRCSPRP